MKRVIVLTLIFLAILVAIPTVYADQEHITVDFDVVDAITGAHLQAYVSDFCVAKSSMFNFLESAEANFQLNDSVIVHISPVGNPTCRIEFYDGLFYFEVKDQSVLEKIIDISAFQESTNNGNHLYQVVHKNTDKIRNVNLTKGVLHLGELPVYSKVSGGISSYSYGSTWIAPPVSYSPSVEPPFPFLPVFIKNNLSSLGYKMQEYPKQLTFELQEKGENEKVTRQGSKTF